MAMLVNKLMTMLFFHKMFNSSIFKKAILSLEEKEKEVSQLKKKKTEICKIELEVIFIPFVKLCLVFCYGLI